MALSDYLERLALISGEGPRETSYRAMRADRARQTAQFMQDLEDQKRRMFQFSVSIPPQDYQKYGGGNATFPGSQSMLSFYPLHGKLRVTSPYGVHRKGHSSAHTGIDWGAALGTPIYAPTSGRIRRAAWDKIYGNQTILDFGGNRSLMFGHQQRFAVKPGQMVKAGQLIGYVGSTGWSTGPHLHFETWLNGQPVNPLSWFM